MSTASTVCCAESEEVKNPRQQEQEHAPEALLRQWQDQQKMLENGPLWFVYQDWNRYRAHVNRKSASLGQALHKIDIVSFKSREADAPAFRVKTAHVSLSEHISDMLLQKPEAVVVQLDISREHLGWIVEYLDAHQGELPVDPPMPSFPQFDCNFQNQWDVQFEMMNVAGRLLKIRSLTKLLAIRIAHDIKKLRTVADITPHFQAMGAKPLRPLAQVPQVSQVSQQLDSQSAQAQAQLAHFL